MAKNISDVDLDFTMLNIEQVFLYEFFSIVEIDTQTDKHEHSKGVADKPQKYFKKYF